MDGSEHYCVICWIRISISECTEVTGSTLWARHCSWLDFLLACWALGGSGVLVAAEIYEVLKMFGCNRVTVCKIAPSNSHPLPAPDKQTCLVSKSGPWGPDDYNISVKPTLPSSPTTNTPPKFKLLSATSPPPPVSLHGKHLTTMSHSGFYTATLTLQSHTAQKKNKKFIKNYLPLN